MVYRLNAALSVILFAICGIVSAQSITVVEPNGGEQYAAGDTMTIRWTSEGMAQVSISISFDGGDVFKTLDGASTADSDWMAVKWVIPDTLFRIPSASNNCIVRINEYLGTVVDESDEQFAIHERGWVAPVIPTDSGRSSGCGSGAGLAFLPAFGIAFGRRWWSGKKR